MSAVYLTILIMWSTDSVSTAYGVTDVSLNPEMVEVEAFSKL